MTSTPDLPFRFRHRVRYGECDPQQVVFNARYGDFIDIGITEYLRGMVGGVQGLNARGLDMMVVRQTKEGRPRHGSTTCWNNPSARGASAPRPSAS